MRLKRKRGQDVLYVYCNQQWVSICSISSEKESEKNLNTDSIIVLKRHKMFTRENMFFVKVCEDTKIFCTFAFDYDQEVVQNFLHVPVVSISAAIGSPEKTRCSTQGTIAKGLRSENSQRDGATWDRAAIVITSVIVSSEMDEEEVIKTTYGNKVVTPLYGEKYLSFEVGNFRLLDSFQFLSTSLQDLVEILLKIEWQHSAYTTKYLRDASLSKPPYAAAASKRDRQTDRRTPERFINPARHTERQVWIS